MIKIEAPNKFIAVLFVPIKYRIASKNVHKKENFPYISFKIMGKPKKYLLLDEIQKVENLKNQ